MPMQGQPTPGPLGIYYDRWQALSLHIDKLHDSYQLHGQFPRRDTIQHLLKSLQAFAQGQFDFFYYGFDPAASPNNAKNHPRLQLWDEFPAEDVLTGILLQVQNDLDLFQRAATQRIFGDEIALRTLDNADHLAWLALQPALTHHVIAEPATVLTHFQKSAEFYSIPYADVAIIAIPFTCTAQNTRRDFLAIPHEVGHYVYRHPTTQVKIDLDKLRLSPPVAAPYKQWIKTVFEEMCADIYGCLIAGPVMALDFESQSLATSKVDFQEGDGEHPNPALRPLIYCEVLGSPVVDELVDGHWGRMANHLASRWNDQLLLRHLDDFVIKTGQPTGQAPVIGARPYVAGRVINASDGVKPEKAPGPLADVVLQIVDAMLEQLLKYVRNEGQAKFKKVLQGWAGVVEDDTDPSTLFATYNQNFDDLLTLPLDKPFTIDAKPGDIKSWEDRVAPKNDKLKTWPLTAPFPSGEVKDPDQMEPNTWGSILYANGWTTAGPGGDPGHPGGDPGHPLG
jgi:hypothetical protein